MHNTFASLSVKRRVLLLSVGGIALCVIGVSSQVSLLLWVGALAYLVAWIGAVIKAINTNRTGWIVLLAAFAISVPLFGLFGPDD